MNKKKIIEVKGLVKTYKTGTVVTEVLKGINFDVYEGEFLGIMGPSGAGKSTVLHQLGLLDHPTSGKLLIDGVDVTSLTEIEEAYFRLKKLGYVFQQYRNIPELTALENVFLPMRMLGIPKKEYLEKSKKVLEKVGLGHRLHHHPFEMSGGEQQRVALARALVHKPTILFADEPTANLDTVATDAILNLLTEFNKQGQTVIMVSHEPEHVKYFDRVVRIRDGVIEKIEVCKK